jgi:hypothetical protein
MELLLLPSPSNTSSSLVVVGEVKTEAALGALEAIVLALLGSRPVAVHPQNPY